MQHGSSSLFCFVKKLNLKLKTKPSGASDGQEAGHLRMTLQSPSGLGFCWVNKRLILTQPHSKWEASDMIPHWVPQIKGKVFLLVFYGAVHMCLYNSMLLLQRSNESNANIQNVAYNLKIFNAIFTHNFLVDSWTALCCWFNSSCTKGADSKCDNSIWSLLFLLLPSRNMRSKKCQCQKNRLSQGLQIEKNAICSHHLLVFYKPSPSISLQNCKIPVASHKNLTRYYCLSCCTACLRKKFFHVRSGMLQRPAF